MICLIRLIRRFRIHHFVVGWKNARILPTRTKYLLELSIIDDYNCHELSFKIKSMSTRI